LQIVSEDVLLHMYLYGLWCFSKKNFISQGSVATQLQCGGMFNNHFVANSSLNVTVKEFLKSVDTWQRYWQKLGGMFFMAHSVSDLLLLQLPINYFL